MVGARALVELTAAAAEVRHDESQPAPGEVLAAELDLSSLIGRWKNTNSATRGISQIVISENEKDFRVPVWVILAAHAAIALGTLSGGWRIVHTMGGRITRLKPRGGFCAETAAAISIFFATYIHQPVSTTHVIAGSIAGVGSIHRFKAVRWGIATRIVWAWLMTIPAAAVIAWVSFVLLTFLFPHGMLVR